MKTSFRRLLGKVLLKLIALAGFSAVSVFSEEFQPEYGVRIIPDYGPPQNLRINNVVVQGYVVSAKDSLPLENINISYNEENRPVKSVLTDSAGFFRIIYYPENRETKLNLHLSDSGSHTNRKFEGKDTLIALEESDLVKKTLELFIKLNEKK